VLNSGEVRFFLGKNEFFFNRLAKKQIARHSELRAGYLRKNTLH